MTAKPPKVYKDCSLGAFLPNFYTLNTHCGIQTIIDLEGLGDANQVLLFIVLGDSMRKIILFAIALGIMLTSSDSKAKSSVFNSDQNFNSVVTSDAGQLSSQNLLETTIITRSGKN